MIVALLKAQKRINDAPKVIPGKIPPICPKCGGDVKIIPIKKLEKSELERLLRLWWNKAPPGGG